VTNTLIAAAGKSATGDEAAAEALTTALRTKHQEAIGALIPDGEKRRALRSESGCVDREGGELLPGDARFSGNYLRARSM